MKIYDPQGNAFTIVGGTKDTITLQGLNGTKEIKASEMSTYSSYSPEVLADMKKILEMLDSGKITRDDLRKYASHKSK